jgi:hypothetical protein
MIEEQVAAAIERRRDELVGIVRRILDLELKRLVDAEITALGNGSNGSAPAGHTETLASEAPPADDELRQCRSCGRELPRSEFPKHRRVCRRCKNREQQVRDRERRSRERVAGDDAGDGPRAGTGGS